MGQSMADLKQAAREDLVERMRGEWPGHNDACDMATECADEMTPIHTSELMALASDSEVWNHESELGPARDGKPTIENLVTTAVYELLSNYLHGELDDIKAELEEAAEEDEEERSEEE